jgi:hypothetical protein
MKQLYDKATRELFREFVSVNNIHKNQIIHKDDIKKWFQSNYPITKMGTVNACIVLRNWDIITFTIWFVYLF